MGQARARVNLEGASPGPRVETVEKGEPSPEDSQDMKNPQKGLEQFAKLLKQQRIPGNAGLIFSVLFGKVQVADHLPLGGPAAQFQECV